MTTFVMYPRMDIAVLIVGGRMRMREGMRLQK